jgi:quercetin dioxygenase-like cupin family protein
MNATKIAEWAPTSHTARIYEQQAALLDSKAKDNTKTEHYFAEGVYVRSLHIPAKTTVVGKIHKTEHVCFLMKGSILVQTEHGEKVLEAPHIVVSPPGTKRVGLALSDTLWVNIHPTNERDLAKIEDQFIEPEAELVLNAALKDE